jgi:hypothetical protein
MSMEYSGADARNQGHVEDVVLMYRPWPHQGIRFSMARSGSEGNHMMCRHGIVHQHLEFQGSLRKTGSPRDSAGSYHKLEDTDVPSSNSNWVLWNEVLPAKRPIGEIHLFGVWRQKMFGTGDTYPCRRRVSPERWCSLAGTRRDHLIWPW